MVKYTLMSGESQSVLPKIEKIQRYNQQLLKEAFLMMVSANASALGLLFFGISFSEKFGYLIPTDAKGPLGLLTFGCMAFAFLKANCVKKIKSQKDQESVSLPKRGLVDEIVAPLANMLDTKEKKETEALEAKKIPTLLFPGNISKTLSTIRNLQDFPLQIVQDRVGALIFVSSQLLDPGVKAISPSSYRHRINILKKMQQILAGPPVSAGLPTTKIEKQFLLQVINLGAVFERAPETASEYIYTLAKLLESYIFQSRIKLSGKSAEENLISLADQVQWWTGQLVSPPIGLWQEAQKLKEKEKNRVIIIGDEAINLAKSIVALTQSNVPEVGNTAKKVVLGISEVFRSEKQRLSRSEEKTDQEKLAYINTIKFIFGLSISQLVDETTFKQLDLLFGGRLGEKTKRTPRDLIKEFKNTDTGSFNIDGDTIVVRAVNIGLADVLSCAVLICYPHIPFIEINIGETDSSVIQSINVPTGVLYHNRLILRNASYTRSLFQEQEKKLTEGRKKNGKQKLLQDPKLV